MGMISGNLKNIISNKNQRTVQTPSKTAYCVEILIRMRHGIRTNRLGRAADQRKALIRSLTTDVLTHGRITTTVLRAKYVRKYVDRIITLSKRGDLHARRQMEKVIYNKNLVRTIIAEAPGRFSTRNGGYCRVSLKIDRRKGDAAKTAILELV